jgi:hypothetical protein
MSNIDEVHCDEEDEGVDPIFITSSNGISVNVCKSVCFKLSSMIEMAHTLIFVCCLSVRSDSSL